ncbi:hypothetical protein FACS1894186_2620 [Alphaproteobacteria bacterium]|nr:hypothetical protein FACS1894186_2620 [Alphaproteobacteria bacterium]
MKSPKELQKMQPGRKSGGGAMKLARTAAGFALLFCLAVGGWTAYMYYNPQERLAHITAQIKGTSPAADRKIAAYEELYAAQPEALSSYFAFEKFRDDKALDRASAMLEKAIENAPGVWFLYLDRARLTDAKMEERGQSEKDILAVVKDLGRAIELAPAQSDPYFYRHLWFVQFGELSLGRADLEKAEALSAAGDRSWRDLPIFAAGMELYGRKLHEALRKVSASIKARPADARLYAMRWQIKKTLGEDAESDFERARSGLKPEELAEIDFTYKNMLGYAERRNGSVAPKPTAPAETEAEADDAR